MQISIWEKQSFYAHHDVVIIGAGLVGLWTAYEIKRLQPKASIVILEKGIIPTGASTRNAGFACFGSPTELLHDKKMLGESKMLEIAEMRYKGISKIRKILADDLTGYEACGGYECLNRQLNNLPELKDALPSLNKSLKAITRLDETFTWQNNRLDSFGLTGFDAMIENTLEAALHSGKLVQSLTKLVQSLGVNILTGLQVNSWQKAKGSITIDAVHFLNESAKQEIKFTTDRLIVCTNAFTSLIAPGMNVSPGRGQIIVTSEIDNLKMKGTFHYDEGFYYFRNLGKRILLGGARNKAFDEEATTNLDESPIVQEELERFLKEHIAKDYDYTIEYRWSGVMGFTEDKQPAIKQLEDNICAVIACNGMGVALSPIIAEQVASLAND